ncbi:MAG: chaperone modulator CbpM [Defluviitaleaceae bacterium]|nr:chaperone modulator CbpM [Defluviitaleaceae bacterium]
MTENAQKTTEVITTKKKEKNKKHIEACLLSRTEVCKHWGIGKAVLNEWVEAGVISPIPINKNLFHMDAIKAVEMSWLNSEFSIAMQLRNTKKENEQLQRENEKLQAAIVEIKKGYHQIGISLSDTG